MTAKKTGLVIFWISTAYMVIMGWLAAWWASPVFRELSFAELGDTIWAVDRPLFWLWAMSVPLGAVVAGVGMLLYVGSKASRIWLFGVGVLIAVAAVQFLPAQQHNPPVFGIVGGLILASFLAIVWLWAKKRSTLEGSAKTAADYRLAGYVFLVVGMWNLCGTLGALFLESFASDAPRSPVPIILFLFFGWLFLLLGQYKETKAVGA